VNILGVTKDLLLYPFMYNMIIYMYVQGDSSFTD
jgi:hypothetical protein